LPGFRERDFPDAKGRIRTAQPVSENATILETGQGNAHVDFTAWYSQVVSDWDIGFSGFHGLRREARLPLSADETRHIPHYGLITQAGVDLQFTNEEWLWKFEGIAREEHGSTFAAMVGGFEYTFCQISDTVSDLGFFMEYHHDGRDPASTPSTAFDNDVFVGTRWALNDIDDTQALAGIVADTDDGTSSLFVEAERCIGDSWKVEAEARFWSMWIRRTPFPPSSGIASSTFASRGFSSAAAGTHDQPSRAARRHTPRYRRWHRFPSNAPAKNFPYR
jgi:hypothetical protein